MKKTLTLLAFLLSISNSFLAVSQTSKKPQLVKINWPKEEKWHVADEQKSDSQTMTEFLKGKETFENFSELGTTYLFRGAMYKPVLVKMEELYNRVQKLAPTAKKTIIDQDENAECPWYIYKIESPTESQIWYAVQGKNEIHVSFWAVRTAEIQSGSQDKWVKIFKAAVINCK